MGLENILRSVHTLIDHWKKQGLTIVPGNIARVETFQQVNGYKLPADFREFYSRINGMGALFPNYMDDIGFLFYPIEALIRAITEFKNSEMENVSRVFLFCEYMHSSWWYGCDVINDHNYTIGIIANRNSFKLICHSLPEFTDLYISDSSRLYDYS